MPLPRPLPAQLVEVIGYRLRVLGDPTRIRILGLLDQGPGSVQELTDQLATTHQNVSKHLAVLHQCGMVSRHRDGSTVVYELVDWTGWWLIEQIAQSLEREVDELSGLLRPSDRDRPSR
jgi:DNA-binding transcriptional ArsR family regulator